MSSITTYLRGSDTERLDPYPVKILKRVDRPTIRINEEKIQRADEREAGFNKYRRGEFGNDPKAKNTTHPLSDVLQNMQGLLRKSADGDVLVNLTPQSDDPEKITCHIKETAYFFRADLVGVCKLPPYAVYRYSNPTGDPIELNHKYAIAILVDQDWKTSEASTGDDWISTSMAYRSYTASGFIACMLADYIRRLGYPARAHMQGNNQIVIPPVLLWAGLGEMSRIGGALVNPFLGPRFKAAVVTTDLPLVPDRPIDFGLQDFCAKCKKCARECPSGAISSGDKIFRNGYETWPMDVKKCTIYRRANKKGVGCGVCINVCPWNKPYTPFHRSVRWTMRNIPLLRNFAVWADDIMGYGKPKRQNQWWMDLKVADGEK